MTNRLANETSPYLLQHAENPVDWYAWGPEALERAKAEEKPIFLSIGYSACHWCHVMEHESFEDPSIAEQLNRNFVNIKVDREERPDLDQIYMNAVQVMTGRGGWPMSVFLTPDLQPFYGGTYWPPQARMGMPGFDQVIRAVSEAWQDRREAALEQAQQLTDAIKGMSVLSVPESELSVERLFAASAALERVFDSTHGGFGGAPKFPHSMDLQVLLRVWKRHPREALLQMVTLTLDKMASGGLYDHLGGGFHRYSVDERWLVPHFEKMLYDNALLATCYLEGYQATGNERYANVVRETLDYVLRDMTAAEGGFYSTQDADSEGEEGKYYVWTPDEVEQVLGAEAARTFNYVYDVSESGNFEGKNILNLPKSLEQCAQILRRDRIELERELAESRRKLLEVRSHRVAPGLDDKVLVSWNGLMIDAMARAGATLAEPRYVEAAARAGDFVLNELRRDDGRLLHSWRQGQARFDAFLDDYACLVNALVTLYETTFDERWIDAAVGLAETMLAQFRDDQRGGFYYTAEDHEPLIARNKDVMDGSVPSGNSMAATALLRLGKLTGRLDFASAAEGTMVAVSGLLDRSATALGQMLIALDGYLGPMPELVLLADPAADETKEVVTSLRRRFVPNYVLACRNPQDSGAARSPALADLFAGKQPQGSALTLFVCQNFTCEEPVVGREAIEATWERLAHPVEMQ